MKRYSYAEFSVLNKSLLTVLLIMLIGLHANGQYLKINLNIPDHFELKSYTVPTKLQDNAEGEDSFTISTTVLTLIADENIHVLTNMNNVKQPVATHDKNIHATVLWAKQNDGTFILWEGNQYTQIPMNFPISDGGRIKEYYPSAIGRLQAWLFITTRIEASQRSTEIVNQLTIEII